MKINTMNNENKAMTGFASIDKPWLKYYDDGASIQIKTETVYDYFISQEPPLDSIAFDYYGKKILYREFLEAIEKAKQCFRSIGIKKGDVVTLCMPTIPEVYYIFFALNQIGSIVNLIDPRTNIDFIRKNLTDTESSIFIYIDTVQQKFEDVKTNNTLKEIYYVPVSQSFPDPLKSQYDFKNQSIYQRMESLGHKRWIGEWVGTEPDNSQTNTISKEDIAAIVYTSGTTEIPKGAILTNKNIITITLQNKACNYGLKKHETFLEVMPPFIAYGLVCGIVIPSCYGMHMIIIPVFKQEEFADLIRNYKPNHIMGVPSMMVDLTKDKKLENEDLSFLKTVVVGGDSISVKSEQYVNDFLQKHNCKTKVMKGYGMTEMSSSAVFTKNEQCNLIGSVGIPCLDNILKIIDPDSGEELGYGENGEICLTGPSLIQGYFKNKKLTDAVFIYENGERWIHTGDIGYMTEDGILFLQGRSKRMIIRYDGFKVIPGLIEKTICTHNEVKECAVVGIKDVMHGHGKLPVACVILKEGEHSPDIEKRLKDLCESNLPEYEQPVKYLFVDSFPLTSIGKTNYQELEKMMQES